MLGTTAITSLFRLFLVLFTTKTRINFLFKALRSKDVFLFANIYMGEVSKTFAWCCRSFKGLLQ